MTVAAACSRRTCFRASQERTAEGFVRKQETRVNMPVRALGKPGYTSARAAVNVGMNGGTRVRSGTESMGYGPGSEQCSDLQADAYSQGEAATSHPGLLLHILIALSLFPPVTYSQHRVARMSFLSEIRPGPFLPYHLPAGPHGS